MFDVEVASKTPPVDAAPGIEALVAVSISVVSTSLATLAELCWGPSPVSVISS